MSDFNSLVQYTVENISRPVKYIIYKLTEFIRVVDKFVFRQVPSGAASGYATIEQIEGNTVKFNQSQKKPTSLNDFYRNYTSNASFIDGIITFTATRKDADINLYPLPASVVNGHIILISVKIRTTTPTTQVFVSFNYQSKPTIQSTNWQVVSFIKTAQSVNNYIAVKDNRNSNFDAIEATDFMVTDLTAIFGAGNEPTTVAEFESWLAQNIGTLPYYDYNAGELLSVKMSGMQTQDANSQTLDTIALDVTTITGINTSTNVREVMFADSMKQADREGTVKDTLDLRSDTATVNVGSRAYQSGDESDTSVITDGTTTYYALTTPITYTDLQDVNGNPLNPRYKVEQGGTEQVLPVNTSTPTTVAPTLTTTYTKGNN